MIVGDFLVTFGYFGAVSEYIIPQKEALECYFNDESQIGEYSGMIQTEGICKDYFDPEQVNSTVMICTIETPLKVNLKDSFALDLSTELLFLIVWVAGLILIGIFLAINHCL